jgi:hypothetical protein
MAILTRKRTKGELVVAGAAVFTFEAGRKIDQTDAVRSGHRSGVLMGDMTWTR